jgi:hypothetical protein
MYPIYDTRTMAIAGWACSICNQIFPTASTCIAHERSHSQ